jgi:hypothetical protein
MKLGTHMDYHGSRPYAPDAPSLTAGRLLKRLAGPLTAWAEHLLEMLLKPGASDAAETVWLVRGNERHFSVLGSEVRRKGRRSIEALWPEGEPRYRRPGGHHHDND